MITREHKHLLDTDARLFQAPFTAKTVQRLEQDPDLAERVEAFVSRFSRLQDTLGDKLLPALLRALGERTGAVIDNLDRAEKLGYIPSVDTWLMLRNLRNQMVHEYIEDPTVLAGALMTAHEQASMLDTVTSNMLGEIERRGWV